MMKDILVIKRCCAALNHCTSRRMVIATLNFLIDRYVSHPSPRLPKHLQVKHLAAVMLIILLTGCMSITLQVQPEHQEVQAAITGSDCVPIVLGLALGTATVEAAQRNGMLSRTMDKPIKKVRTVQVSYYYFLIAGAWCVEVTGE